jgi:hypothetical protein
MRVARDEAQSFGRSWTIDPFGLVARTPDDWTCDRNDGIATTCSGPDWLVSWDVVEERKDPRAPPPPRVASRVLGDVDLASFHGRLTTPYGSFRGELVYTFDGRRDDPARGPLRIVVEARGSYGKAETRGLAVLLTTDVLSGGLAPAWPTTADRAIDAQAERDYALLASDAARCESWVSAIESLQAPRENDTPTGPRVSDSLRARVPSVADLVQRRVDACASIGDVPSFRSAIAIAIGLRLIDDAAWDATLRDLAPRLRAASVAALASPDAGQWLSLEVWLAQERARSGDTAPIAEVARWLTMIDPAIVFRAPGPIFPKLAAHVGDRDVADLFARWLDPARVHPPDDTDFIAMSEFTESFVYKIPVVREHALGMLDDKRPCGSVEVKPNQLVVQCGKASRITSTDGWGGLPAAGTTIPLRVCDHYAYALRFRSPGFTLYADVADRDRALPALRAFVASHAAE